MNVLKGFSSSLCEKRFLGRNATCRALRQDSRRGRLRVRFGKPRRGFHWQMHVGSPTWRRQRDASCFLPHIATHSRHESQVTVAGLEPTILGSEDQRLTKVTRDTASCGFFLNMRPGDQWILSPLP